ncbi:MAG TPA: hypothetical protein VHR41_11010 [Gemmatimonadales bacterium]|jgi:hypothetical protein|nr:hypothetical protein [Gemmatimonadales bacterium]
MTPIFASPRRAWLIALGALVVLFVLFSLYLGLAFAWSYSDGQRAGVLQKFSRKGWFCKTYEGELAMSIVPGVTPTIWEFSVRDPVVVNHLKSAIGNRVALHYTEHRGIPTTCFGQTNYFVDSVAIVR